MEENKFDTDLEDSDLTGLVSKKEAAEILGVSEKTIQRLSRKDQIVTIYKKKYHGGYTAYFPLSDVERVKAARENNEELPTVKPSVFPPAEEPSQTSTIILDQPIVAASVIELVEEPFRPLPITLEAKEVIKETKAAKTKESIKTSISAVEAAAKLILTVEEVSILTHLPEKELREELKKGRLRGLFKGHGWKVKRADLEEYVRSIYVPRRTDTIEESGTNEIDLGDIGEI
ncbi:MAG: helix-turn-helix domain-containing protein [Blastocatellia bacterium]